MDTKYQSLDYALSSEQRDRWVEAIDNEMTSISDLNVYSVVNLPSDLRAIQSKWIFDIKKDEEGNILRYKARLVAREFSQILGLDYGEIYSPVVRHETMLLLLALATDNGMHLYQVDVKTAFIRSNLEEEIFMELPDIPDELKAKYSQKLWNNRV